MAVTKRGSVQLTWNSSDTISWPAGTIAGDLAIVWSDWPHSGPTGSGWNYVNYATWWKRLTSSDIALGGPGTIPGRLKGVLVVSGARGLGKSTAKRGATVTEYGGAVLVEGWTRYWTDASGLGPSNSYKLNSAVRGYQDQWCAWWLITGNPTGYRDIDYDGDSWGYRGYEILPIKPPNAPTIVSPVGEVDITQPIHFQWVHNSDEEQAVRQIRVKKTADASWSYVLANGTIGSDVSAGQVATDNNTALLNVGQTISQEYTYQVCTANQSSTMSGWSPAVTFLPVTPPTVVPTLTTVAGSLIAAVSWVPTTPRGSQTAWQVAIAPNGTNASHAVWMSPVTQGLATATVSDALSTWVNGGSYQAWVRVQQTGGVWSQWTASTAKTVSWTTPATPSSLTVVDGHPPTATISGVVSGASLIEMQFTTNGTDWENVGTLELPATTEQMRLPQSKYGVPVKYRVRAWKNSVEGVPLPSEWRESDWYTLKDRAAYLIDPVDGSYLRVGVTSDGNRTVVQGVTVTYGLGAKSPRVDKTAPAGQSGSTILSTFSAEERDVLVSWLTTKRSWYFRWNPESGTDWVYRDAGMTLMTLSDSAQINRLLQVADDSRSISFSWVEVSE